MTDTGEKKEKGIAFRLDFKTLAMLAGLLAPSSAIGGLAGAYGPDLIADVKEIRVIAVSARTQQFNNMIIDLEIRLGKASADRETAEAQLIAADQADDDRAARDAERVIREAEREVRETKRAIQNIEFERDKMLAKLQ